MAFRPRASPHATPGFSPGPLSPPPLTAFATLEECHAPWEDYVDAERAKTGASDQQIAARLLGKGHPPSGQDAALRVSAYRLLQSALPFPQRD
eukprot:COSAG06_NODE_12761_length_1333_cov_1.200972_1_plen_92_part_10